MVNDKLSAGIYVALHFLYLGLVAWATGRPFIFPSLGPSAYLLAVGDRDAASGPYHVIGGHLIAVIGGLVAYHTIASGLIAVDAFSQAEPFASDILLLAASSILAMILTTVGMLQAKTNHPAACATTLIVALGLLSSLVDGAIIMASVVMLVGLHNYVIYPGAVKLGFEPEDPRPKDPHGDESVDDGDEPDPAGDADDATGSPAEQD
ncbi:HPP family protein [Haloferacaceae archaeon DSL9]